MGLGVKAGKGKEKVERCRRERNLAFVIGILLFIKRKWIFYIKKSSNFNPTEPVPGRVGSDTLHRPKCKGKE